MPCSRHVNRLCLAAGVPLVESGTAGYVGQTYVIKKGESRCFDCEPVTDQKTYPICTIRRSGSDGPVGACVFACLFHSFMVTLSTGTHETVCVELCTLVMCMVCSLLDAIVISWLGDSQHS